MSFLRLSSSLLLLSTALPLIQSCPQNATPLDSTLDLTTIPTYSRADTQISTPINQLFLLELPSNPSTGYSWQISEGYLFSDNAPGLNNEIICSFVRTPATGVSMLVGSGGVEQWLFNATEVGEQLIPFQYVRPWEKELNYEADPTFVLTVEVTDEEPVAM